MADKTAFDSNGTADTEHTTPLPERVLQLSNPVGLYSTLRDWQSQFVPRSYPGHQTRGPARPTSIGGRVTPREG